MFVLIVFSLSTAAVPPWQDDPANCIYKGKITYKNTVKEILNRRCTICHGEEHDPVGYSNPYGFAVAPVDSLKFATPMDAVTYASSISSNVESGHMPPPTEPDLSAEDASRLIAWFEQDGGLEGSAIPTLNTVSTTRLFSPPNRYRITYQAYDPDSVATVAFFYDTDNNGFDGTLIAGCLSESTFTIVLNPVTLEVTVTILPATYTWNATAVPAGTYYVYGCVYDTETVYCDYAPGSITR